MSGTTVSPGRRASPPAGPPPTAPRRPAPPRPRRFGIGSLLRTAAILAILFFLLFPIAWLMITAFKPEREVFSASVLFTPSLENFAAVFTGDNSIAPSLVNSVIVSVATTVISVPLALLAAYAFSRYRFPGSRSLMLAIVLTQFIPGWPSPSRS
ncbi:hypothetical protein ACFQXA_22450 [Nocardiopsis composta]